MPPTLREGDSGEWVIHLQEIFISHGLLPAPANGSFDAALKEQVEAFQGRSFLDVDGTCGPETWRALGVDDGSSGDVVFTDPSVQPPAPEPTLHVEPGQIDFPTDHIRSDPFRP